MGRLRLRLRFRLRGTVSLVQPDIISAVAPDIVLPIQVLCPRFRR